MRVGFHSLFWLLALLYSLELMAVDLSLYPSVESTHSYWRDSYSGEDTNIDSVNLRLKAEWDLDSVLGVLDAQVGCQSGSQLDFSKPCEGEVIEAFAKWETDVWNIIFGRYSYRIGSGISTNPSQPERAGMRNDQGPFVVDRGSDMLKISGMMNDELSLGVITIFERDQNLWVPYVTIDHEGESLQSRSLIGQRFFGQNLSATPWDILVLYLEYNLHRPRNRLAVYSDVLLGMRVGLGTLPLSLGIEFIRNSHGLDRNRSQEFLENLDRGVGSASLGTRYDSYEHRKPGSEDTFTWGPSQWLSRDLIYLNLISHWSGPWSPIVRGYHSLSDGSSLSISGVQYTSLASARQLTTSFDLENFYGSSFSEWGWVNKRVHRMTFNLRLGLRW